MSRAALDARAKELAYVVGEASRIRALPMEAAREALLDLGQWAASRARANLDAEERHDRMRGPADHRPFFDERCPLCRMQRAAAGGER